VSVTGFDFVDTAIGGVQNRNRVMRAADVPALIAASPKVDCFTSVLRFTEDLARYAERNRSPSTGKPPSVSGYPGPALPLFAHFDFDDEETPERALEDTRTLVHRLHGEHDVSAKALRLAFSGMKGCSVGLPSVLFGGFEPGQDVHERLGRVARELTADLATVDLGIYDKLRLWRITNTQHGKTGLFKVPLTAEELLNFSLDEIRYLARAPRQIVLPDESDFEPCESLVQLWLATAKHEARDQGNGAAARAQNSRRHTDGQCRELLSGAFTEPGRHNALKKCAAYFFATQRDPAIARIIVHDWNAAHCIPPQSADEVDAICDWLLTRELKGGQR
jgi:hypothetical protein